MTKAKVIKLSDYKTPDYTLPTVDLEFLIESETHVTVRNTMAFENKDPSTPLVLAGKKKYFKSIKLDGNELDSSQYLLDKGSLTLKNLPQKFTLQVETLLNPQENKSGDGLYMSGKHLTTQCEAENFRDITFHPDRPDVMSVYSTRIEADKAFCKVGKSLQDAKLPFCHGSRRPC